MRFWITSFMILFALAKMLEWLHGFEVTTPVFVAAGVLLAIASNYDKRRIFPFWPLEDAEAAVTGTTSTAVPAMDASTTQPLPESWSPKSSAQDNSSHSTSAHSASADSSANGSQPDVELPPFNN